MQACVLFSWVFVVRVCVYARGGPSHRQGAVLIGLYISQSYRKEAAIKVREPGVEGDGEVKRRRRRGGSCNVNLWRSETCAVSLSLVTVTEVCVTVLCSTQHPQQERTAPSNHPATADSN